MAQTSLDQGGSSEGGRMWLDFECFKDRVGEKSQGSFCNFQFSSVAQSCPTLCDPMNRSILGLPVHHKLPEFTQTHAH